MNAALPSLPRLDQMALLLDIDGTLLDFAPAPELVHIPPTLAPTLCRLRDRLDGALGMITGRPIGQVDALFPGVATAVAGEHGAVLRHAPAGPAMRMALPSIPGEWLERAADLVAGHPGARLEAKASGFVLHYRQAPGAGDALRTGLAALVAARADAFRLMPANMAWEVKPTGVDKGTALRALMGAPPFVGRSPVFIGDDVTDQDAIAAAAAMGGVGWLVADHFSGPNAVCDWLATLA